MYKRQEDIESKLGLDDRIELRGHGAIPDFIKLFGTDCVLNNHVKDSDWICIIQYPGSNAVKKIIDAGYEILEWKRKSPDIVELLCHATGLEIEDIGMELQTSDMMPLRSKTEEE